MAYQRRQSSQRENRDMIFHSALVKAVGESGPVRLTVDNEPKYIKTRKGDQNDIVEITLAGAGEGGRDLKATYWCENERCADFFKGKKGQTFSIIAKGGGKSPEEKASATIEYAGESRPATGTPASNGPTRQSAPTKSSSAPIEPEKAIGAAKVYIAHRVSLLKICTRAAMSYVKEVEADKDMPLKLGVDQIEKLIVSLFISSERAGFADHLPAAIHYHDLTKVQSKNDKTKTEPAKPVFHCPQCGDAVVQKEGEICADCQEVQKQAEGQEEEVPF